ncbi:unnamed protein product [Adineta steineri]|uniref:Uncharacterized protein n=1 Tax=Adineta steineri TaxID=433720 RepID=A0A815BDX6_9BILA|nr:unnamed protein product [Adineta steineri]
MNILNIILSIIILHIGICKCNNITSYISNKDGAGVCYYCTNCPKPFSPDPSSVMQVYSSTGWCAMLSRTDSADTAYTRNAAPPGMCYTKGCSWQLLNGNRTWICCCNDNLCNWDPPTTDCYYCSSCPRPFNPKSYLVSKSVSKIGWCYRKSSSSTDDQSTDRGVASPGLCSWNECSWKIINNNKYWVCCCNGNQCNKAISISKSTINILSFAIIIIVMFHKTLLF